MVRRAFVSSRIVTSAGIRPGTVLVEGEKILGITPDAEPPFGYEVLNFGDSCILPGLVDTHVHINDPGRSEWEGFWTATRAAAAGGFTTIVDMPLNCLPGTTTVAALEQKRDASQGKAWVDWMSWGGLVAENVAEVEPLVKAGVPGFKCFLVSPGLDGFSMVNEFQLRQALPSVAAAGIPLLVHAELSGPIVSATQRLSDDDWSKYSTYLSSRPDEAEVSAIALMIRLCKEYGAHIHIVHVSSAESLSLIKAAREQGLRITAETCPHYLYFTAKQIADGATHCKCAPPIRDEANQNRLWDGLREGILDMIVSDHSPCPPSMKHFEGSDFQTAWGGIASLSLGLSVVWTKAAQREFSLSEVVKWMAEKPAMLAGLSRRKGRLAEGYDADMVIFDPDESWLVTSERLHFRHPISAYTGETLTGSVQASYLRGEQVYGRGEFGRQPAGKELQL